MLEPEFLQMSTMLLKVESLSTQSDYGAPSYASPASSWPAFYEAGSRMARGINGVQQIASGTIYVLSSSASIGPQDRLTWPDGRQPKLLRVDVLNDEEGQHHLELLVD